MSQDHSWLRRQKRGVVIRVPTETYIAALRAEGLAGATAYIPSPIYMWRRLDPDSGGPRMMWQENLRRSGVIRTASPAIQQRRWQRVLNDATQRHSVNTNRDF